MIRLRNIVRAISSPIGRYLRYRMILISPDSIVSPVPDRISVFGA
jgi:hypothetical protein